MKKTKFLLVPVLLAGLLLAACADRTRYTGSVDRLDPAMDGIIAPGTRPEILAGGFNWIEGPLWVPDENALLFSDIPENIIFRWDENNGLQPYLQPSGYTGSAARGGETGSNGLLLDRKGNLVLCQHGDRRIARMDACTCKPMPRYLTLADNWNGLRFNSPNDGVYSSEGVLYFTDPAYGLEHRFADKLREMDFAGVFRLDPHGRVDLLTDTLSAPNGIGLSPAGDRLYVAVSGRESGLIWVEYDLDDQGYPREGRLFYDGGEASDTLRGAPDGMDVRSDGILFATGPGGAWVFRPDGTPLGIIRTGQLTSNCTLDEQEEYLYMTCDSLLLRIRLVGV